VLAIWVKVKIKAAMRDKFLKAIEADALGSARDEPGCLRFDVLQDEKDENVYYFYEVYKDQAALEAHCQTPHYAIWREVADVLEGPLAATSGAIRRLGGVRWQWLRRLVYVIGLWPTQPTRCRPVFPAASAYWGKTQGAPLSRVGNAGPEPLDRPVLPLLDSGPVSGRLSLGPDPVAGA
jgi:autoinducer 2-degrading protein